MGVIKDKRRRTYTVIWREVITDASGQRVVKQRWRRGFRTKNEAIEWERSTGVLVLSGHFGNWELLVFAHGIRGHPVHVVHRAIANPLVDRWLHALRTRAGTRMIRKRGAAASVIRALHERGLLVLPIDQNSTRGLGVFVRDPDDSEVAKRTTAADFRLDSIEEVEQFLDSLAR